jgi:type II restriction/modification system DNA methylase subunit YeeA
LAWQDGGNAAVRGRDNRLFIAAYGLNDEMTPEVPLDEITLTCNPAYRYGGKVTEEELESRLRADTMTEFLSYAVGCMMGRYSPDHPGLILADAGDSLKEYLAKVKRPLDKLTFAPDEDGIIPVLDGEWFEDDIVARTRDFLRATFGETTLNENLRFIEESLGKELRKYFQTDFYKNHLQTYKKRPIYWLFRSPKGAFAALVYLHRMTRDTPNLVLNRYLRNYLVKLRARIEHLDHAQAVAATAKEKTAARKESDQLKKNLRECEEWERDVLLPLAQSRPELDLDDGVKVNYLKLGEALAPIPGLAAAEDE